LKALTGAFHKEHGGHCVRARRAAFFAINIDLSDRFGIPISAVIWYKSAMLNNLESLPDDPLELKGLVVLLASELKNRDLKIADLKHQLAGHNRHRFGSTSENLDQLHLSLENEEIAASAEPIEAPEPDATEPKNKPKRKPLPRHLERNEKILTPGDNCSKCGGDLKRLGEDVTEELEYVPGRFIVNRIVRPRMACSCCEAILQAPMPSRPIERGRPGPGLLAPSRVCKAYPAGQRMCWSRSIVTICRYIANPKSTNEKVLIWIARQWRIGLANQQPCWNPWLMQSANMYAKVRHCLLMTRR